MAAGGACRALIPRGPDRLAGSAARQPLSARTGRGGLRCTVKRAASELRAAERKLAARRRRRRRDAHELRWH